MDVSTLLALSQPRRAPRNLWPVAGVIMLGVLLVTYFTSTSATSTVEIVFTVIFFGTLLVLWVMAGNFLAYRARMMERAGLAAAGEMVQLRRWDHLGQYLQSMLMRPMRCPSMRASALSMLAELFTRRNRLDDALAILNHLVESVPLDPQSRQRVKFDRAQVLLMEDRLVDAHAAIADLRRDVSESERDLYDDDSSIDEADDDAEPGDDPATGDEPFPEQSLLTFLELHRDVKTGHAREAIEAFRMNLPHWTKLLSHRVSEAYALVACAFDHLADSRQAQEMYAKATLLCPAVELSLRYREVATLAGRYNPSPAPREVCE